MEKIGIIREEILVFADQMEIEMKENESKKGDSYKTMSAEEHREGLDDEIDELWSALIIKEEMKELIDVANRCWMLWHSLKKGVW